MTYTEAITCEACKGQGYLIVQNGPDDFDKEPCDICEGTGKQIWEVEGKNG